MKKHVATYMPVTGWGKAGSKWQVVCRTCQAVGPERDTATEAASDLTAHYRGKLTMHCLTGAK